MADYLAQQRPFMNWLTDPVQSSCKETAYEHVTRNVTVALCVTGLVVTWGTARDRGNREGDDLVLDCCALEELSAIADIPCFGDAMEHAGWAVERSDDCVVFPKFFKDQESPDDRHKRQGAERQAKFRAAHTGNGANVTVTTPHNVTVTTEKRREEKDPIVPFDRFWMAYPLKVKKAVAMKAWAKVNPDEALTVRILSAVASAKQSTQWRDQNGKFIPHASTWLNGQQWNDEATPPPSPADEQARKTAWALG